MSGWATTRPRVAPSTGAPSRDTTAPPASLTSSAGPCRSRGLPPRRTVPMTRPSAIDTISEAELSTILGSQPARWTAGSSEASARTMPPCSASPSSHSRLPSLVAPRPTAAVYSAPPVHTATDSTCRPRQAETTTAHGPRRRGVVQGAVGGGDQPGPAAPPVGRGPVGALLAQESVGREALAQGVVDGLLEVEVDVGDHGAGERRGGLVLLDRTVLTLRRDLAETAHERAGEGQRLLDVVVTGDFRQGHDHGTRVGGRGRRPDVAADGENRPMT